MLAGADPAFCAGLDLKALAADGPSHLDGVHEAHCIRLVGELVGAVNDAAFTGGLEIALGCGFLIASDLFAAGWDATTGAALSVEVDLAAATTPDWDALESNRRCVMVGNRAQL